MNIAIPVSGNKVSDVFSQSNEIVFYSVSSIDHEILWTEKMSVPTHRPSLLAKWLVEKGIKVLIAGTIDTKISEFLKDRGVKVVSGVTSKNPDEVVKLHLKKISSEEKQRHTVGYYVH